MSDAGELGTAGENAKVRLAAVITDGLTNSRLDVYDMDTMRRLERREGWSRSSQIIVGKDGRLWFDIPDAVLHFMQQLKDFERKKDISVIVPVARGGTCALLDAQGALLPREIEDMAGEARLGGVISYINAASAGTDAIFDDLAPPLERYRAYGLPPNFTGYAVPARTIVSLANEFPDLLRQAGSFAFGPEIMARLFCAGGASPERNGLELTYLMCHTGLWKDGSWSALARAVDGFVIERTGRKLIGDLMPEAASHSSGIFDRTGTKAAAAYGLGENTSVLNGGHDSTIADLPVIAACENAFGKKKIVHFQAGSWGMARLLRRTGPAALPDDGFGKNVMYQGDLGGNPVLTASAPSGVEFQHYAGAGPAGRGLLLEELDLERLPYGAYSLRDLERMVSRRELFITPGVAAGIGPYPNSTSEIYGKEMMIADRSGELAYIALNLETTIMATAAIELVEGEGQDTAVVLSAGAAADPLYRLLLASLNPARQVYYLVNDAGEAVTETTSDGGFLLAVEHARGIPANEIDVSGLGYRLLRIAADQNLVADLKLYREEFERRAGS
jgi:hypothetical protein